MVAYTESRHIRPLTSKGLNDDAPIPRTSATHIGVAHRRLARGWVQAADCADFDAWQWAQTAYESDPDEYAALDQDGDGEACPELSRAGFAPLLWADEIPRTAEYVTVLSVTDGDTFDVQVATDNRIETVRLYQADTPETKDPNDPVECGGAEATAFLDFVLSAAGRKGNAEGTQAGQGPRNRPSPCRDCLYTHR